ncbi:MAG: polysaccharide deacetylase family protein, partial [Deltaproteobacteria bacterium]
YGRDPDEIEGRIATVRVLASEGHELASHGVRHLHGRAWSSAAWRAEFDEYERYMHDVVGLPAPRGFRSPFLEWSPTLFESEAERHLAYDASRPVRTAAWPQQAARGVWEIGVPMVFFPTLQRVILSFDDSFRIRHLTEADVEPVYFAEFERRYRGSRAPMVIASHGNYTAPALRLATQVCRRPDVRCATFHELADYMTAHPELAGLSRGARLASAH